MFNKKAFQLVHRVCGGGGMFSVCVCVEGVYAYPPQTQRHSHMDRVNDSCL